MQLIIDIGNSLIKIGVFDKNELLFKNVTTNFSENDLIKILTEFPGIENAMISSVREANPVMLNLLKKYNLRIAEFNELLKIPLEILYQTRNTLGADRIAAAVGAEMLFRGRNILVIDFGTAMTIDFVNSRGQFEGGIISPGLYTRFRALHDYTGKLPLLSPSEDIGLIGKSTIQAITFGVQNGIVFEIDAYISQYNLKYNDLKIVITGGDADFFGKRLKNTIFADSNLVLKGLNRILRYNEI